MMNWGDYFYYDESSPSCLRWKVDIRTGKDGRIVKHRAGDVAGSPKEKLNGLERYTVMLSYKNRMVHKIIWELANGPVEEGREVDHENGDGLDNRLSNLRSVTRTINSRNRRMHKRNTSGVTGVQMVVQRGVVCWRATWCPDGGKVKSRTFSESVYGQDAKVLAVKVREEEISKIPGYTERHGK